MPSDIKPSCVVCAWRNGCNKQFSLVDPSHCQDFSADVSIKDLPGKKGVKLLIEGEPGSGKTSLIERLITRLDVRAGGFFTREIREHGERKGFRIIALDKLEGILAHVDLKGGMKVGRYTVNLEDLEKVGVASVERALREDDLIVIDEIGNMELFSKHFEEVVDIAMRGVKPVVATVPTDGPPFVENMKKLSGVRVIKLGKDNREEVLKLAEEVLRGDVI